MLARATNWKRVPIKSVYIGLYDGPHATPKPSEEGPVFLGIKNITDDGRLNFSDIRHISEAEFPKWTKRVLPQEGDIVFTYEATLNRYSIIPKGFRGCLGRRMALIRPNPEKVDTRFLFHYFFGADWRHTISKNILSGSTVDRIPLTKFPEFEINLPPLETQRKIANILSAYEDLIANNTRRIKILEEMAQAIYREWFVNFRFPGHESTKMVNSSLGKIPAGWEIKTINDVVSIKSGFAFKSKTFVENGDFGLVTIKNVQDGNFITECNSRISDLPQKLPDYCYLKTGDVLLSLTGNIGRVCLVYGEDYLLNQRVAKLVPHDQANRSLGYLIFKNEEMRTKLENLSTGVAQQNLSPVQTGKVELPIPNKVLLAAFSKNVEPIFDLMRVLFMKNKNLRQTRDLLLPKLISGELS